MSFSQALFSSKKKTVSSDERRFVFSIVISLLSLAVLLWITDGYHTAFFTLNQIGSILPDSWWSTLTLLADTRVALVLILFFVFRHPILLPTALIASVPVTLITQFIKRSTEIPRPAGIFDVTTFNQIGDVLRMGSFPSGHSATVGVFIALVLLVIKPKQRTIWLAIMMLVGCSRVMVGAHWPIDVFVGLAIGLVAGYFSYQLVSNTSFLQSKLTSAFLLLLPFVAALSVFEHDGGYPQGYLATQTITIVAVLFYLHQVFAHLGGSYQRYVAEPTAKLVHASQFGFNAVDRWQCSFCRKIADAMLFSFYLTIHFIVFAGFKLKLSFNKASYFVEHRLRRKAQELLIRSIHLVAHILIRLIYALNQASQDLILAFQQKTVIASLSLLSHKLVINLTRLLRRIDVLLFLCCIAVFTAFPSIDINTSAYFYNFSEGVFTYKNDFLPELVYKIIANLPIILLIALPILTWRAYKLFPANDRRRRHRAFLLVCLLLGPGLLVNVGLKDNSIGRARPSQVDIFSGEKTFTPAFVYSGECSRNCSFVSGHAAMGFYFIALGWILMSPTAFFAGMSFGILASLMRILQGGHFLSDTVFAFWAVYLVTVLVGKAFSLRHPLRSYRPHHLRFQKWLLGAT